MPFIRIDIPLGVPLNVPLNVPLVPLDVSSLLSPLSFFCPIKSWCIHIYQPWLTDQMIN